MPHQVRRHPSFVADYLVLLEQLEQGGERERIVVLAHGLEEVVEVLSELPGVGVRLDAQGSVVMRKIIFKKGPYVAWYAHDSADPEGEVWLLRLFHARQKRPAPRARRWLRGAFGP